MKRLFANCLVVLMLLIPFGASAQITIDPDPDPDTCPTVPPGTTDLYCYSANSACETVCENLNVLIYFTPDGKAFFDNSGSRNLEDDLANAISNFELAMANSLILNKTITYSVYEAQTLNFTRVPNEYPTDTRIGCTAQTFHTLDDEGSPKDVKSDYNADVVVVIDRDPNNSNYMGGVVSKIGLDKDDAFSIIEPHLLGGNSFTFAHELAHLLGARHHINDHEPDPNFPVGVCQHGWRLTGGFNQKYATIMGRGVDANGVLHQRIPYFSNPDVRYFNPTAPHNPSYGTPTGNQFSNNATWIARSYCDVSNYDPIDRIVLQHGPSDSRDAFVQYIAPFWNMQSPVNSTNYGSNESLNLRNGTISGAFNFSFLTRKRAYLDFDWDRIPANTEILEARLSLYYNPDDQIENTDVHLGDNQFTVSRVTSSWDEQSITWNNQPQTTSVNQVNVPASTSNTQDYISIDVTDIVKDMFDVCVFPAVEKHGFQLKLLNEQLAKAVILASSEHPNPDLRPKLEITFNSCNPLLYVNCLTGGKQAAPTTDFVKVYPNPTTDKLNLKFAEGQDSQIALFDLQGKQVFRQQSTGQYDAKISLAHLPKGVYILKVNTSTGLQHSQKIHLQ